MEFPDDENGDILRQMEEDGDDLSKPRDVEFFFTFDNETDPERFCKEAEKAHPDADVGIEEEDDGKWLAVVALHMVPAHAQITKLEKALGAIAKKYEGEPEGWGCPQIGDDEDDEE